jgi:hypothetical protein
MWNCASGTLCVEKLLMTASRKATLASLLRGVAWLFVVLAGLAFWVGGRAISEFAKTERVLAEMEGIALAVLFGGLGAIAKTAADRVEEDEGDISLSESLRK